MKFFILVILMMFSFNCQAGTPCSEWANFSKIISYKFHDKGIPEIAVKKELKRVMGDNAEIETALGWVGYVYSKPDVSPVDIWRGVFTACNSTPTL